SYMNLAEPRSPEDPLFVERLQTLYEKSLSDIRMFAQRESKPFNEVLELIEEMHCRHLFGLDNDGPPSARSTPAVQNIVSHISKTLESLEQIAGLQSFFLIVNPSNPTDTGFLGGTIKGRNFWQGHRGCGAAGAQAFRLSSVAATPPPSVVDPIPIAKTLVGNDVKPLPKKTAAMNLKAEVYSNMRTAVRNASGIRNAEMKWSNHSHLDSYNIRIVGWPEGVPKANPSTLSMAQNRAIFDGLANGTIHFVPTGMPQVGRNPARSSIANIPPPPEDLDVFEGTIDFSGGVPDDDDAHAVSQTVSFMGCIAGVVSTLY
ncbi:hypothetical protein BXZ70DRAFT_894022, partial [Cristinia sonorae]